MKKILILGATGMAGHVIHNYLESRNKYVIENVSFRTKLNERSVVVDVREKEKLSKLITIMRPDIIINCIGVLIRGATNSPKNAIYLNSYLPHFLSDMAREIKSKLIHISTDCVFSGKDGGYTEGALSDAEDLYGRSKSLGEIVNDQNLTIRTSIIGPELKSNGEGLLHWFFKQDHVQGYSNVYWSGVTTLELAKAIDYYINSERTGLLNLTNSSRISKYELLKLVTSEFNLPISIEKGSAKFVDKSLKTNYDSGYKVDSYNVMLSELRGWMMENSSLYIDEYPSVYLEA
ncbi:dTDP-4-dehydrorhamnose reductase family protein [Vibrio salilacus]|uniref:dTDP-4-dehydrorhamnose reductase family protein n=1 Tax=Vibrio salilacus TaxID=1323749 RepID=UPI000C2AF48D|nr:SDR family oxidoreductase [Vibrio salilacus]